MKILINDNLNFQVVLDGNKEVRLLSTSSSGQAVAVPVPATAEPVRISTPRPASVDNNTPVSEAPPEEAVTDDETVTDEPTTGDGEEQAPEGEDILEFDPSEQDIITDGYVEEEIYGDVEVPVYPEEPGMTGTAKKPLLSSVAFLVILTVVVIAAGTALGLLLARRKIKKGLDIDENY